MKVYDMIVFDFATGEVIYEKSYDYTGPIIQLKGGKGGSSGGSTSEIIYTETPTKQSTKSVSAGATAAAAAQREQASRNRGVAASILTQRRQGTSGSAGLTSQNSGSSTLG